MSGLKKIIEDKFKAGSSINIVEDKFKGIKTSKLDRVWTILKDNNLNEATISIEYMEIKIKHTEVQPQIVNENQDEDYEVVPTHNAIRLILKLQSKDWWFLNRGELILLAGGRVINLGKPVGRNSFTGTVKINNKETHVVCNEHCVYILKEADLNDICSSDALSLQLSGKTIHHETDFDRINHDYFRLFFNKVFDTSKYTDVVERLEEFERESTKANVVFTGVGCVLPIILFLILYNSYETYERYENNNIWFGVPFFIFVLGVVMYGVLSYKAKKKANLK
jgi:hypothetical protein